MFFTVTFQTHFLPLCCYENSCLSGRGYLRKHGVSDIAQWYARAADTDTEMPSSAHKSQKFLPDTLCFSQANLFSILESHSQRRKPREMCVFLTVAFQTHFPPFCCYENRCCLSGRGYLRKHIPPPPPPPIPLSLSVCVSVCLSVCLSVSLSLL